MDLRDGAELADAALAAASGPCQVIVEHVAHVNQRWARTSLTTNGATESTRVTVIAMSSPADAREVRTASVTESVQDRAQLVDLVARAEAAARDATSGSAPSPLAIPPRASQGAEEPARACDPAAMGGAVLGLGEALGRLDAQAIEAFGYLELETTTTWLWTSSGLRLRHVLPQERLEITAKSHGRTRSTWHGMAEIEPSSGWDALTATIAAELELQGRRFDVSPGRMETVLPPTAVADLMIDLAWSAGSRDAHEGRTAFHDSSTPSGTKVGQRVGDERATLSSDPADPLMPCSPFLATQVSSRYASALDNGQPLARTEWIRAGILERLFGPASDNAAFGLAPAWPVDNLRLELDGGAGDAGSLCGDVRDGLLLTCVWYNRTVDPQTMLLTGLTRDGVYVVKGGELVGAANNFRFNDSPLAMLSRILGAGETARTLPREMADYANRAAMPALRIADMNFTSVSDAQ